MMNDGKLMPVGYRGGSRAWDGSELTRENLLDAYDYIRTAKTRSTESRLSFLQRTREDAQALDLIEEHTRAYWAVVHAEMFALEVQQKNVLRDEMSEQ